MPRQSIQKYLNNKYAAYGMAGMFLILAVLAGISIGTVNVPILTIIKIIGAKLFSFISFKPVDPCFQVLLWISAFPGLFYQVL